MTAPNTNDGASLEEMRRALAGLLGLDGGASWAEIADRACRDLTPAGRKVAEMIRAVVEAELAKAEEAVALASRNLTVARLKVEMIRAVAEAQR